jgi:hypothetical protein
MNFTADEIRSLLSEATARGKAGPHSRACVRLGVNCGRGTSDVAHLPETALGLAGGWLDYDALARARMARREAA